ncbi:uncharacterized protein LOC135385109 [Ornithodoros turicata]|uniref:uncharacterized protein LOC135385109 n=1 Tax=Ornithodoros turicata TaxID=34597 RepID=UPI00313874B7
MAVFPAPLHSRGLQHLRNSVLTRGSWDTRVQLSAEAIAELRWWVTNILHCQGKPLLDSPIVRIIQTDSSLLRWGAVWSTSSIDNLWNPHERCMHINQLELKAAFLGLQAFARDLRQGCVLIQMDSTAAIAAINKLGSARSPALSALARDLWSWCFQQGISVRAEHLPGKLNTLADWASRNQLDSCSWRLLPAVFPQIQCLRGPLAIDLFADYTNHQLPTFYSWKPDPLSSGIDAFTKDWSGAPKYAFPPFALIGRCLQKLQASEVTLCMVTPVWPTQAWYPSLIQMAIDHPRPLPHSQDLLENRAGLGDPLILNAGLQLAAWSVSNSNTLQVSFHSQLQSPLSLLGGQPHEQPTLRVGRNGLAGVVGTKLIRFLPL